MKRPPLDERAVRDSYVGNGLMTPEVFQQVVERWEQLNSLDLGADFHWPLCYLARDLHMSIPWARHLQAWSAGLGLAYEGIEPFYHRAIERGVFPNHFLNHTLFYRPPADAKSIPVGRLLQQLGLVSAAEVQRALGIQHLVKQELGLPMRVGRLLSSTTRMSLPDFLQAMAMHFAFPFESIERTMVQIERESD